MSLAKSATSSPYPVFTWGLGGTAAGGAAFDVVRVSALVCIMSAGNAKPSTVFLSSVASCESLAIDAAVAVVAPSARGAVPAEINLIGLTVDEALPRVDKLLDDAALSERREIRVIHGFGAGRLKKAVAGLLDGHPHVASFRMGQATEGGGGATIVELKD